MTSLHRAPRKQQRQRDALDWQMPRVIGLNATPRMGRGDGRLGGSGYLATRWNATSP